MRLSSSQRGPGLSICCVVGLGRLQGLLWHGIGLPGGLSGRTYSNEGGGLRRVWPARRLAGDADWAGIQQRCKSGQYPGGVSRAQRTMRRAPGPSGFRCRRWRANPVSIDSSSTYRGYSPNGHHPSSDLAVVVVHLPSLGHVAAAATAVRLPSLDHVAVAAAAAHGLPSVQQHLSESPPPPIQCPGVGNFLCPPDPPPPVAIRTCPDPSTTFLSLASNSRYVMCTRSSIIVSVRFRAY